MKNITLIFLLTLGSLTLVGCNSGTALGENQFRVISFDIHKRTEVQNDPLWCWITVRHGETTLVARSGDNNGDCKVSIGDTVTGDRTGPDVLFYKPGNTAIQPGDTISYFFVK